MVRAFFSRECLRSRSAMKNQLITYPIRQPGKNQSAESPSLYASPTVPSMAHALSELAVDEMAVTQALSERSARKKSAGEWVAREVA